MIRKGWVLEVKGAGKDLYAFYPIKVYMTEELAIKGKEDYSICSYSVRLVELEVIDRCDAINDTLESIERGYSDYQATISAPLEEVIEDINNPTTVAENEFHNSDGSIKSYKISDWLHSLAN